MSDIIISGGGMVGLTAACALAQKGYQITLIEAQPNWQPALPALDDPIDLRVVAINQSSQQLLAQVGAWTVVESNRYCAYEQMKVWDSVADGEITFSADECLTSQLGYIVEQKVLLGALWQTIRRLPGIQIIDGSHIQRIEHQLNNISVTLSNGARLSAKLLVAAEGAQSPVRKLMGIETRTKPYEQTAIVATNKSTKPHRNTAYQRFAPEGPLAWLPLSSPHLTSIVWTNPPEEAKRLCELPESLFNECLTRESAGVLGELTVISDRKTFVLQRQHAKQYGLERCVLVGDAAHTVHPLAGQGVNCGFRDVQCLLESIHIAQQKSRDIGSQRVIQHYQRHAKWQNQVTLATMDAFKWGFGLQNTWVSGLRNAGLNWVDKRQGLKRFFIRAAGSV